MIYATATQIMKSQNLKRNGILTMVFYQFNLPPNGFPLNLEGVEPLELGVAGELLLRGVRGVESFDLGRLGPFLAPVKTLVKSRGSIREFSGVPQNASLDLDLV